MCGVAVAAPHVVPARWCINAAHLVVFALRLSRCYSKESVLSNVTPKYIGEGWYCSWVLSAMIYISQAASLLQRWDIVVAVLATLSLRCQLFRYVKSKFISSVKPLSTAFHDGSKLACFLGSLGVSNRGEALKEKSLKEFIRDTHQGARSMLLGFIT